MASGAADAPHGPAGWDRLDRAARGAAAAVAAWKARAMEAEAQVRRLREELEAVTGPGAADGEGAGEELRRLRAEHALLTSRAGEARQRIAALLARLTVLEGRR
jgi:hypothetical protein